MPKFQHHTIVWLLSSPALHSTSPLCLLLIQYPSYILLFFKHLKFLMNDCVYYYECLCRMVTTTVTCQPSTVRALTPHHLTSSNRKGLPPILDWPWGMACARHAILTKHLKSELWPTIHPFIQTTMTRK